MGGSSSSKQKAEGDLNFNNIDYGRGGGPSPLKNLNIGRDNELTGNTVNVEVTDGGAFKTAGKALDNNAWVSGAAIQSNAATARTAMNTAVKVNDRSLDFGRTALQENSKATGKALDFGRSALSEAINFVSSANRQSQEAVQDTTRQFTNKFSEFANRQSNSDGQRVQDLAKWGIGAAVAVTAWNTWNARKK